MRKYTEHDLRNRFHAFPFADSSFFYPSCVFFCFLAERAGSRANLWALYGFRMSLGAPKTEQ